MHLLPVGAPECGPPALTCPCPDTFPVMLFLSSPSYGLSVQLGSKVECTYLEVVAPGG